MGATCRTVGVFEASRQAGFSANGSEGNHIATDDDDYVTDRWAAAGTKH